MITIALAGAGVLASCSTNDTPAGTSPSSSTSTQATSSANAADVQFAQMMIVHHQGAIEMASLAADRANRQEVKDLAHRIEQAQQPEIDTMTAWLDSWGEPTLDDNGAMPGMDHGDMSMGGEGGMASGEDMQRLTDAAGAQFDELFLQLMIVHHQGAVTMAQAEVDGGTNPDAVSLAKKVISDQSAEIAEMKSLLAIYAGN